MKTTTFQPIINSIHYHGVDYKYSIYEETVFGEKAIRIICKGAGMNEIFSPEDLDMVINKIIPEYIEIRLKDNKSSNLQIRIKESDKKRIQEIAKKENISISDLIIKRILA